MENYQDCKETVELFYKITADLKTLREKRSSLEQKKHGLEGILKLLLEQSGSHIHVGKYIVMMFGGELIVEKLNTMPKNADVEGYIMTGDWDGCIATNVDEREIG